MFKPNFGLCQECPPDTGEKLIVINKPHLCDYHNRLRKGKEIIKTISAKPKFKCSSIKKSKRSSKYKQIYWDFFGYKPGDWIPCEIPDCGKEAVDINHIECDGMGGTKEEPKIENLMGTCREHHIYYGDKKQYKEFLISTHLKNLKKP